MGLQCHMKEKRNIMYLVSVFVTLVGVHVSESDSFMVKSQTGFLKTSYSFLLARITFVVTVLRLSATACVHNNIS